MLIDYLLSFHNKAMNHQYCNLFNPRYEKSYKMSKKHNYVLSMRKGYNGKNSKLIMSNVKSCNY